jgi:hypothetical protein
MKKKPALKFEDYFTVINEEISKRRNKWSLTSLNWIDYDDVSQIIRIHIHKKWDQFDQNKPIQPWLNVVIAHQIKNLIRNFYSNFARPCLKCHAAVENHGCKIYTEQCEDCPLYANWKKYKEPATNIKIPVSIENHNDEVKNIFDNGSNIFRHIEMANVTMKQILKPLEYQVYEGLFILHQDEATVAKKLGYISNEKGRNPGYKQIKNIRKAIIIKFKQALEEGLIDIY